MNEFEIYDGEVVIVYENTPKQQEEVVKRIIDWCKKYNVSSGEDLMQSDDPIIEAPVLISEIIDDVLNFQYFEK